MHSVHGVGVHVCACTNVIGGYMEQERVYQQVGTYHGNGYWSYARTCVCVLHNSHVQAWLKRVL